MSNLFSYIYSSSCWLRFLSVPHCHCNTRPSDVPKHRTCINMATAKVGRKRHSPIWDYFEYDAVSDKSKCLVVETDNTTCGALIKGKNPTNLKVHLKSSHKKANQLYLDKLKDAAPALPPSPGSCSSARQ